jgi:acyl carrier protein
MGSDTRPGRNEILKIVIDSLQVVSPEAGAVNADTHLLGANAALDSVGFITLLVTLEQNLPGAVDLSTAFMELDGVEETRHPFSTVGSLTDHIGQLLASH